MRHALIGALCLHALACFSTQATADTANHQGIPKNASLAAKPLHLLWSQRIDSLQTWMEQAYSSNPKELQKSTQVSPREMAEWVFHGPFNWKFDTIQSLQNHDALKLSISDNFHGDRILAFTTGVCTLFSDYYKPPPNSTHPIKPIIVITQEIQTTLDSLIHETPNEESKITISTQNYEALITLLRHVEFDSQAAQPKPY